MRRNHIFKHGVPGADSDIAGSRFRHDRFFYVLNQGWYIETRVGDVGPFSSHETAQHFLDTTYPRKTAYR